MSRFSSVFIGQVVNVMDPLQSRRVQVQVPAVMAGMSSWARSCVAPGANAGSEGYRVGDNVVVAFESGDPAYPIVLGRVG
jgi:uncharacterized protein involved in type VI secretion and phage assembly